MKNILLGAVREAMKLFHRSRLPTLNHLKLHTTGCAEVVTELDLEVERFLCENLKARFPKALFLGEELSPEAGFHDAELCFIIDPIDGTVEYLGGGNCYGVSVGVSRFGSIISGAIGFPAKDVLLAGTKGAGIVVEGAMGVSTEI